mgnify:CR=1 FL=1
MKSLIATLIILGVTNTGNAQSEIPESIQVPAGNLVVLKTFATGYQVYQCQLKGDNYVWQLKAPDAKLFNDMGQEIGSHYQGPTWEYKDGSRVMGKLLSKYDSSAGKAIPWLLVAGENHGGQGVLADVSYINRLKTKAGLMPASGCDSNHIGSERSVAYTAEYYFYSGEVQ